MRLIDADALWMVTEGDHDYYERFEIENAPTVDAVEVVRCKDCFHYWDGVCKAHNDVIYVDDNDFCSMGERKDEID